MKGAKKRLGVRVDKEANELAERELIREALDCSVRKGLMKTGWTQISSGRFLSSGLPAEADDPVDLLIVKSDMDGDDQVNFSVHLDSVRLKHFPVLDVIPRGMQTEFHEGREVSWMMDTEDRDAFQKMRCVVLPSLEDGLVVGTLLRVWDLQVIILFGSAELLCLKTAC